MVIYVGLFVADEDKNKLIKNEKFTLTKRVKDFHVTLEYKPKNIDDYKQILGKVFEIEVVGYGANKENSGFLVELPNNLMKIYNNLDENNQHKPVHITTSLSNDGRAVNTYKLDFKPIDPFMVKVKAGVVNQQKEIAFDVMC